MSDLNSQRKESDGPSLDSLLLIPISRRAGVEVGALVGLPTQYVGTLSDAPVISGEVAQSQIFPKASFDSRETYIHKQNLHKPF